MDVLTYISGVLSGGLGLKIIEKFIDFKTGEAADKRKQKAQNKFDLSTKVLEILNEGSNKSWKKKPEDQRHINFIARQLELEDQNLADKFTSLINNWNLAAERNSHLYVGGFSFDKQIYQEKQLQWEKDEEFIRECQHKADKLDKEVSNYMKSWRK